MRERSVRNGVGEGCMCVLRGVCVKGEVCMQGVCVCV